MENLDLLAQAVGIGVAGVLVLLLALQLSLGACPPFLKLIFHMIGATLGFLWIIVYRGFWSVAYIVANVIMFPLELLFLIFSSQSYSQLPSSKLGPVLQWIEREALGSNPKPLPRSGASCSWTSPPPPTPALAGNQQPPDPWPGPPPRVISGSDDIQVVQNQDGEVIVAHTNMVGSVPVQQNAPHSLERLMRADREATLEQLMRADPAIGAALQRMEQQDQNETLETLRELGILRDPHEEERRRAVAETAIPEDGMKTPSKKKGKKKDHPESPEGDRWDEI